MNAADLLDDGFPHGTPDGYRTGCHGSACPAPIACRDVYRRYQGDYAFKRALDGGATAVEILAAEEAEREDVRRRDREAARQARAAETQAARVKRARAPKPPRPSALDRFGPEIARLHGEGLLDPAIASELGMSRSQVGVLRRQLGLAPHRRQYRPPRVARPRVDRRPDVARLHGEGFRDDAIAERLGLARAYVAVLRRELLLPPHPLPNRPKKERVYVPRDDRRPDVAAAHADGITDRQIGERIGLSRSEVGRLRRDLGLTANAGPRAATTREVLPCGTNASYARGCRCDACHQAQREYYREWQRRKRAEGIPAEHHGTPYGYQLGCRGRKACPAETSCTDAMLAEERRRRREAGIPAAPTRVPAAPIRDHVRALMADGMSVLTIADTAQVSRSGLKTLLYGRSGDRKGHFPAEIEADKAQRLLALERTAS
ncbi:hypothetical protein ACIGCK_04945 [Microbacterium sp. NPDC078428]|uniref:hypothetical protein n=1 Tax=Microbacterium sp. NPDC078428 TaxID=3364190 RepID=UPI0037C9D3BC